MSKRDELKFAVKKSLIVGTATATLGAMSCQKTRDISNPVPSRNDAESDVADAGTDTSGEPDVGPLEDGSEPDDASSDADPSEDGSSDAAADASDDSTDGGSEDVSGASGGG